MKRLFIKAHSRDNSGANKQPLNDNWGTDTLHRRARRTRTPSEHVVSHIMRRVAEYGTATEVRLLLPHWQESHTGSSRGPILVQQWADLGRRCGSVLVQQWADLGRRCGSVTVLVQLSLSAGYSRHGLGAEVSGSMVVGTVFFMRDRF
jgi:hypothetical protein